MNDTQPQGQNKSRKSIAAVKPEDNYIKEINILVLHLLIQCDFVILIPFNIVYHFFPWTLDCSIDACNLQKNSFKNFICECFFQSIFFLGSQVVHNRINENFSKNIYSFFRYPGFSFYFFKGTGCLLWKGPSKYLFRKDYLQLN